MIKKLLIVVAAIVIAFLAYVAMQPAEMRVARSAEISAPADAIFPHINSLKKFDAWSPWAKLDPNAVMTYEGPDAGKGAIGKWKGNDQIGEGSMTIVETTPPNALKMKLDFIEPWPGEADVEFTLEPAASNTKVTWAMETRHTLMERAMCILLRMNPEKMIGNKYEEGLANLKKVVEAQASAS